MTSEDQDTSYAAAGQRIDANDDVTLNLDYQQTLTGPTNNQARLEGRYQIHPNLALEASGTVGSEGQSALGGAMLQIDDKEFYVHERLADHRRGKSTSTVVGTRAMIDPSTKIYSEYQWEKFDNDIKSMAGLFGFPVHIHCFTAIFSLCGFKAHHYRKYLTHEDRLLSFQ